MTTDPGAAAADEAAAAPAEQLALVAASVRKARVKPPPGPAEVDPVARVSVDVGLAHLDRPFDYLVPEPLSAAAQPGTRVRVRFSGKLVDGWVLARSAASDHVGRLERVAKVVSPDPVLAPEIVELARAVADRWAGTLADVLRAAVPPRHAAAEAAVDKAGPLGPQEPLPLPPGPGPWAAYAGGAALVRRLADARHPVAGGTPAPRAVWTCGGGADPAPAIAHLVHASASAGRGALVVAPDARDVARLDAALTASLGPGRHVVLSADAGPSARYRAVLAVRRGHVRVVLGTRAAVFAPVRDLGLLVLWDDGDDSLAEPHAPYWHAREVLALRSELTGAALVVGSTSRSVEAAQLVATGWAREVALPRAEARRAGPRVTASGSDTELARDEAARSARLPHAAWEAARAGLSRGPVLVQVPRRGYVPGLACQTCREPARCVHCHGPLGIGSGQAVPVCGWCGRLAGDWRCSHCGGQRLRATSVGERRTAEELGRAFPGVPVRTSGRDPGGAGVLDHVDGRPALVVATPGAEPRAEGGYAAALLLDGRLMLDRPDLRAAEEAVRRWTAAVSLVRPASEGGVVVLLADASLVPVQAVVRHDPAGFAARELAEREALRLPPAWRVAEVTGRAGDVEDLLGLARLPASATVLGPVPVEPRGARGRARAAAGRDEQPLVRALVSAPRSEGAALASALREASGVRSARKEGAPATVRIDPVVLG
ncbi:MAG: primosomal protein N' [Candidatus Nanopelagicales bacterium]